MKFFRVLWRVNAVLIFVLSIALVIALIFVLSSELFRIMSRYKLDSVHLDDESESDRKETWSFGELKKLTHSGQFLVPLVPEQAEQAFSIKGYPTIKQTGAVRNYLFIDTNKNHSFWLFDTHDFVISELQYVRAEGVSRYFDKKKAIALCFVVHKKDTNKDNAIKRNDQASVALTKPDGSDYTEIEQNIDQVKGLEVTNGGKDLVLFYEKQGKIYLSKYSLAEFKKRSDIEIDTQNKF
jgi:hypothetical protein